MFSACNLFKNSETRNYTIIGRWCSKSSTADYPHLTFKQDGYVFFDCKIDTFFALKYTLNKNYLLLTPTDQAIIKDKILKLTNDSLIFETLLDHKIKQEYYRCK